MVEGSREQNERLYKKLPLKLLVVVSTKDKKFNIKNQPALVGAFRLLALYKKRCVKECKEPFNYPNILLWSLREAIINYRRYSARTRW
jgi:hypothetical protein